MNAGELLVLKLGATAHAYHPRPTICLSGGYDSRLILAALDDIGQRPSVLTLAHPDEQRDLADKKLGWIRGTTARWDAYLEFQRRPQPMLDWFEEHMA